MSSEAKLETDKLESLDPAKIRLFLLRTRTGDRKRSAVDWQRGPGRVLPDLLGLLDGQARAPDGGPDMSLARILSGILGAVMLALWITRPELASWILFGAACYALGWRSAR